MGLPGRSIPGQHDGPDTVDVYGKPNGWCWFCWQSHLLDTTRADLARVTAQLEEEEGATILNRAALRLAKADLATAREENARLTRERDTSGIAALLYRILDAYDVCDRNRGAFSCHEEHDLRCPKSRVDSPEKWKGDWVCECGREELDSALGDARALRITRRTNGEAMLAALTADRDALRAWKAEAMAVLTEHDNLARGYVTEFGLRELGQSVVRLVVEDARALRTQLAALRTERGR